MGTRGSSRFGGGRAGIALAASACALLLTAGAVAPATTQASATSLDQNVAHDGNAGPGGPAPPLYETWERDFVGLVRQPLIADGKAFVTTDLADHYGWTHERELHALDLETGQTIWSRTVEAVKPPLYMDGKIVIPLGARFEAQTVVFDADTGEQLSATDFTVDIAAPVGRDGTVYVPIGDRSVGAIDAGTGEKLWTASIKGGDDPVALDGDAVYSVGACDAYALDRHTGEQLWHHDGYCGSGGGGSMPIVHGGRVYAPDVGSADDRGNVVLDAETGELLDFYESVRGPAFSGQTGVFDESLALVARDVESGEELWRVEDERQFHSPIISGDLVYAGNDDHTIRVYDLDSGEELWRHRFPYRWSSDWIDDGISVGEGTLLVPHDGKLEAFTSEPGPSVDPGAPTDPGAAAEVARLPPPEPGLGEWLTYQGDDRHGGFLNVDGMEPPFEVAWSRDRYTQTYPLLIGDRAYLSEGDGTPQAAARIVAVRAADGSELWSTTVTASSDRAWLSHGDGRLYVHSYARTTALDPETGAKLWERIGDGFSEGPAFFVDGHLVLDDGLDTVVLDAATGSRVWRERELSSSKGLPAAEGSTAFLGGGGARWAVDVRSGEERWRRVPCRCGFDEPTPVLTGDELRYTSAPGIRDPDTGELLAYAEPTGAVAGDITIRTTDISVRAERPDGTRLWRWEGWPASEPFIVGRHVIVAQRHAFLVALDLVTGEEVWRARPGWIITEGGDAYGGRVGLSVGAGLIVVPTDGGLVAYRSAMPDTVIEEGPPPLTNDPDVSFSFSSNNLNAGFECRLDEADWQQCPGGSVTFEDVADGDHLFEVRYSDGEDVDLTPASSRFAVDATPPATTLQDPERLGANSVLFEFTSSEPGSAFSCQLDTGSFRPCSSPHRIDDLDPGSHNFRVRATDLAGNREKQPARSDFSIEAPPEPEPEPSPEPEPEPSPEPEPEPDPGPEWPPADAPPASEPAARPDVRIVKAPHRHWRRPRASFRFASAAQDAWFICDLDGTGFEFCSDPRGRHVARDLSEGRHALTVLAYTADGGFSSKGDRHRFEVDLTKPRISVKLNGRKRGRPRLRIRADEPLRRIRCRIDRGPFKRCGKRQRLADDTPGTRIAVRARDRAGNWGGAKLRLVEKGKKGKQ